MRVLILGLALALTACASSTALPSTAHAEWPFPDAPRGSAIAPPAHAEQGQIAPPEGAASGGVDFGHWRQVDPAAYAPSFQAQMRQRYAGRTLEQIRADLAANGFACEEGAANLQCRIEIMEHQCAFDWYVVLEPNRSEPVAGFDQMCLGARH